MVAVLGANGAGKTTLLRAISGLVSIREGTIKLMGEDLRKHLAFSLAGMGVVHIPEGRQVFSTLTVEENIALGAWGIRNAVSKTELKKNKLWVYSLFPRLKERKKQLAGTLSGGEQQMLAIGRGLVAKPKILLLDEPSLGLAPILVQEIFQMIKQIHEEEKVSILLVEQNARKALGIADYGYILETGRVSLHNTPAALKESEHVRAAYLGGGRLARGKER